MGESVPRRWRVLPEAGKGSVGEEGNPTRPDSTHNPPQHEGAGDRKARRYDDIVFNIK